MKKFLQGTENSTYPSKSLSESKDPRILRFVDFAHILFYDQDKMSTQYNSQTIQDLYSGKQSIKLKSEVEKDSDGNIMLYKPYIQNQYNNLNNNQNNSTNNNNYSSENNNNSNSNSNQQNIKNNSSLWLRKLRRSSHGKQKFETDFAQEGEDREELNYKNLKNSTSNYDGEDQQYNNNNQQYNEEEDEDFSEDDYIDLDDENLYLEDEDLLYKKMMEDMEQEMQEEMFEKMMQQQQQDEDSYINDMDNQQDIDNNNKYLSFNKINEQNNNNNVNSSDEVIVNNNRQLSQSQNSLQDLNKSSEQILVKSLQEKAINNIMANNLFMSGENQSVFSRKSKNSKSTNQEDEEDEGWITDDEQDDNDNEDLDNSIEIFNDKKNAEILQLRFLQKQQLEQQQKQQQQIQFQQQQQQQQQSEINNNMIAVGGNDSLGGIQQTA